MGANGFHEAVSQNCLQMQVFVILMAAPGAFLAHSIVFISSIVILKPLSSSQELSQSDSLFVFSLWAPLQFSRM